MTNIIVAFARQEDGRKIKSILVKSGFLAVTVCTCGAQVLSQSGLLGSGIVVCGYRFGDMNCRQLREQLSNRFEMLLAASPSLWSGERMGEIVCLPAPFTVKDLVGTVRMMEQIAVQKERRLRSLKRERSEEEKRLVAEAKRILMDRNRMTEPQAHRYLQKCSMDSGTSLPESAAMVIRLYRQS